MKETKNKKYSSAIFFLVSLVLIVLIMFFAKYKTILKKEVRIPFNAGITNITTSKNFLTAVGLNNKIYVCDWDKLSKEALSCSIKSEQAALVDDDCIISLQKKPQALIATSLKDDKEIKEIFFASNYTPAFLNVNAQSNTIAVLLTDSQQKSNSISYQLNTIDIKAGKVNHIADEKTDANNLTAMAVSNNGELVAIVGDKNGKGWIEVFNVKQKQKLSETILPQSAPFISVSFSKDDKSIFTGGREGTLYKIKTDGKLLIRLMPPKSKKEDGVQPVLNITVSPDGRLVAANEGDFVNIWNAESGQNIFSRHPGHLITSGIAFSPDGRFLATSDLRQGGTIRIWKFR
jgi:WD40 repeat protein